MALQVQKPTVTPKTVIELTRRNCYHFPIWTTKMIGDSQFYKATPFTETHFIQQNPIDLDSLSMSKRTKITDKYKLKLKQVNEMNWVRQLQNRN